MLSGIVQGIRGSPIDLSLVPAMTGEEGVRYQSVAEIVLCGRKTKFW